MADVGLRDLGAFVPGRRGGEPVPPPLNAKAQGAVPIEPEAPTVMITPPPPATADRVVFAADLTSGPDALGFDAPLAHLAELAAHRGAASPLCIGLLGGAGSGKSFALQTLVRRIEALAKAAASLTRSPFLTRIHIQRLDAASLETDPARSIAADLHAGLRASYPDLAREIAHTARDPRSSRAKSTRSSTRRAAASTASAEPWTNPARAGRG